MMTPHRGVATTSAVGARGYSQSLIHHKRLMIDRFPGDAQWQANECCSAPNRKCKWFDSLRYECGIGSILWAGDADML